MVHKEWLSVTTPAFRRRVLDHDSLLPPFRELNNGGDYRPVNLFSFHSPYTTPMSRYTKANDSVYMTFFFRGGQVQFTEGDLKTPLPRTFAFADQRRSGNWHGAGKPGEQVKLGRCWSTE